MLCLIHPMDSVIASLRRKDTYVQVLDTSLYLIPFSLWAWADSTSPSSSRGSRQSPSPCPGSRSCTAWQLQSPLFMTSSVAYARPSPSVDSGQQLLTFWGRATQNLFINHFFESSIFGRALHIFSFMKTDFSSKTLAMCSVGNKYLGRFFLYSRLFFLQFSFQVSMHSVYQP